MTDNEIIKALGYCKRSVGAILCTSKCPMYSECDSEDPMVDICGLALDLINSQKAEIEKLQDELHRAKVEISKHFDYMDEAKSESINEFAERLKEKLQWDVELDNKLVFESDIDNLVKEMTEELKDDDTKNNISTFDGNRSIR